MADPLADLFATESVSSDPLADLFPGGAPAAPQVPLATGGLRSAAQGLTFGLADEGEALVRSAFGGSYDEEVKKIRDSNAAFGRQRPVLSTLLEVGGAVPTAFVPGMGGANLTRAVAQGGAGQIAKQSANVGMRTGAAHGFGTGEGNPLERLPNAAIHAGLGGATGFVAGPAVNYVAKGVGNLTRSAGDAIRETTNPDAFALKALRGDNATPQNLIDDLLVDYRMVPGQAAMTPQRMEMILTRYGEGLGQGWDDAAARRVVADELIQGGTNPGTAETQVREVVRRWHDKHQIPMQIHEMPALRPGSDGTMSNRAMRVAANRTNDETGRFHSAISERQMGLGEDMEGVVRMAMGGRDADQVFASAQAAHQARNRSNYGAAEQYDEAARVARGMPASNQPGLPVPAGGGGGNLPALPQGAHVEPIDITPDIMAMAMRYTDRAGPVATEMNKAIRLFMEPNTPNTGVRTLRQFIDQKMELDQMIEASMTAGAGGTPKATPLTRELVRFKDQLMQRVGSQNTLYRDANAEAARGFSEERAVEVARNLSLRAGEKTTRALRTFDSTTDEGRDMIRVRLANKIAADLANVTRTGNAGKLFNTPAARRIITHVFGDEAGSAILAHADRVAIAARTYGHLKGQSQTMTMLEAAKQGDFGHVIRQLIEHGNPFKLPGKIADYAANKMNSQRDAALLRNLGPSTERPDEVFTALRRMMAQQQQQQAQQAAPPLQNLRQQLAPFAAIAPERAAFGD